MQFMTENKKRGRPAFKPTRRQRNTVETCVAGGLSVQETAAVLGISQNTLRANFSDQLQNGRARKFAEILVLLDRAARRESVSAMKFLATLFSGGTSAIVGKKQRQQQEAENAGGGEWGDDLYQIN